MITSSLTIFINWLLNAPQGYTAGVYETKNGNQLYYLCLP